MVRENRPTYKRGETGRAKGWMKGDRRKGEREKILLLLESLSPPPKKKKFSL